jgi:hypothetical protein
VPPHVRIAVVREAVVHGEAREAIGFRTVGDDFVVFVRRGTPYHLDAAGTSNCRISLSGMVSSRHDHDGVLDKGKKPPATACAVFSPWRRYDFRALGISR